MLQEKMEIQVKGGKEHIPKNLHMIFIIILSVPHWVPLFACVN